MESTENKTENLSKEELLQNALKAREQEVLYYQINIDNYELALQEIAKMPPSDQAALADFAAQLNNLLGTERLEQKKAKVMLSVVKQQLE